MKKSPPGRKSVRKRKSPLPSLNRDLKPISGRDSSVLAVLAQNLPIPEKEKPMYKAALSVEARKIAKVLLGEGSKHSQQALTAAAGFTTWANSVSGRNR